MHWRLPKSEAGHPRKTHIQSEDCLRQRNSGGHRRKWRTQARTQTRQTTQDTAKRGEVPPTRLRGDSRRRNGTPARGSAAAPAGMTERQRSVKKLDEVAADGSRHLQVCRGIEDKGTECLAKCRQGQAGSEEGRGIGFGRQREGSGSTLEATQDRAVRARKRVRASSSRLASMFLYYYYTNKLNLFNYLFKIGSSQMSKASNAC